MHWFLHYAAAEAGQEWIDRHIEYFISLGGPFRGACKMLPRPVSGGIIEELDWFFVESDALPLNRSWHFPQYASPFGAWK